MRTIIFIGFVATLLSFQCNPGDGKKPGKIKDAEAELRKLNLKSVTIMDRKEAEAMITYSLDSNLKRDYSLGRMSFDDLKAVMSVGGLKEMYFVRANYPAKHAQMPNGATMMVAMMYEVEGTTSDAGTGTEGTTKEQMVYGEVKVCPPPDGLLCLQKLGIKGFTP